MSATGRATADPCIVPGRDGRVEGRQLDDIEAAIVRAELRQALRDGLAELPERDQALLRAYALAEPYKDITQLLQMKMGSVGPTLRRCLDRLRRTQALRAYLGSTPAAEKQKGGDRFELAPLD